MLSRELKTLSKWTSNRTNHIFLLDTTRAMRIRRMLMYFAMTAMKPPAGDVGFAAARAAAAFQSIPKPSSKAPHPPYFVIQDVEVRML